MRHKSMSKSRLREMSEKLGIGFSDLVSGFVLESLMFLIAESDFRKFLWLKGNDLFGTGRYRGEGATVLDFVYRADRRPVEKGLYPGQRLSLKMGYAILASILRADQVPEIQWMGRASEREDYVELEISGSFQGEEILASLRVTELFMDVDPVERELPLFAEAGRCIHYFGYPSEEILAKQLFEAIKNKRAIREMHSYYLIYQILKSEAVFGRHIWERLGELCRDGHLSPTAGREDEILSYREDPYMRKRWRRYLYRRGKQAPSWDDVMDILSCFLPEIWEHICGDEVFFGDWMPQLGRFLD